ncbi:NUDIX hydrolase [Acetobacter sp. AC2005]|uniref:NUDIX hydrolase n=1 Tax=Acetobacter sp. AC2005 TaxID=3134142 RepID=UPI0030D28FC0
MNMSAPDDEGYITVSTRITYENPWTRVREDIIRLPNGNDGLYGIVERGDFVVILPLGTSADGRPTVTLVNQYRYPIKKRLWELPMGMWEARPDAKMEEVAAGELREETGLRAQSLQHAGIVYQGAGYSTQKGHVYLATGLTQGERQLEDTEQGMSCHTFLLSEVEDMIRKNEITCMVSLAAFGLLRIKNMV